MLVTLMPEVMLVNVSTFDDPNLAHIARLRLESEGIQAVLDGEHHVAMDWLITNAVGGVKLLVRDSDHGAAIRILNEKRQNTSDNVVDDVAPDENNLQCCPQCGSQETFRERLKRKWIFLSIMLLGFPIPFLSDILICDSCDHKWTP